MPKSTGRYRTNLDGVEMYRYNAIFTVRTWRELQEMAISRNTTIILCLTRIISEAYSRWRAEQDSKLTPSKDR